MMSDEDDKDLDPNAVEELDESWDEEEDEFGAAGEEEESQ